MSTNSKMMMRALATALPSFVAFALTAGCGDGAARVTGQVTLNGIPVNCNPQMYGTVTYSRVGGGGAPAVGVIDENGNYELKTGSQVGLEPGKYAVGIAVKRITMPTTPEGMPQPHLITPKKYASTSDSRLVADVQPGSNTIDFALESDSEQ